MQNLYCSAQKVNLPAKATLSLKCDLPLKPSALNRTPLSERRLDTAFPLTGDARFFEIQLPFHAAARLVGDSPFLQKVEDVFSLGLNELGAKVGTKGSHFRPLGFAWRKVQAACAIVVSRLEGGEHVLWNVVPVCEFIEPQFRDLERVPSRPMFSLPLPFALDNAIAIQSEQENESRQKQALPDESYNDGSECDEENEVTVREGGAARGVEGKSERGRE
jgi:hypothetical protein